jgi:L-malate glycosyltransferase
MLPTRSISGDAMTGNVRADTGPMAREPSTASLRRGRILHCAYSGLGGHASVLFAMLTDALCSEFDHFVLFFGVEELRPEYAEACSRLGIPFVFVRKKGRIAVGSHACVLRHIAGFDPDVVMVNGTPLAIPILLARSVRRYRWRVVVRETQANELKTRQEWVGSYLAARSADAVVYLTTEYRAEVEARLRMAVRPRGTVCVIPNGVEMLPARLRTQDALSSIRLSMVSRIVPIKDHRTLIEAVRFLVRERGHTSLRLSIAGEGPVLRDLEALVDRLGLSAHVEFEGLLAPSAVAGLLRDTDVYVHCTFGETMSNSILQAMAAGLPIVASDVDGVSNLIRNGEDGLLVPVTDPVALADAIDRLLTNDELRDRLGAAARVRIEQGFSRERMADRYRVLFQRLIPEAYRSDNAV